jgi:DNA helicase II / ATP-dependent DNA helicase PcrA
VACITYTNVAKDEIIRRVDDHPLVSCSTIHGFCWEAMKQFQGPLRAELITIGSWAKRVAKGTPIAQQPVSYALGLPKITEETITLGHADVPKLMVKLLEYPQFPGRFWPIAFPSSSLTNTRTATQLSWHH